ncbi:MAG: hypothetical protein Q9227_002344 [Pyrenula ochraceoflavens]
MADPAAGVSQQLLPHVHLMSQYRYPVINSPSLETIVNYLIEAPKIVNLQPVVWSFLDAPGDGTLMLVWQPLSYLSTNFASDGYIWGDVEHAFSSELKGYVSGTPQQLIEMKVRCSFTFTRPWNFTFTGPGTGLVTNTKQLTPGNDTA